MPEPTPITCHWHSTPLGPMLLAATPHGLCGAWFQGQRHAPADTSHWRQDAAHAVLAAAGERLDAYFAGRDVAFDLPLDLRAGTPFQQAVWQALLGIPRGASATYAGLAAALGRSGAARAVGAAVGRNPVSILVPCHRVLGAGRALTGYAGGLDRKRALLQLEGFDLH